MGRYVDWADVNERYPGVAANVPAERAAAFVDDAESEVDARLAKKYIVPFVPGSSNAPQVVRTLSIDLAYYRMIWMQENADKLKAYIDERFEALLDGTMELVSSGTSLATGDPKPWTDKDYRTAFGFDDPVNWSVSSGAQLDNAWDRIND